MSTEAKKPTERAMRAAVNMEIHAAISTTTLKKAEDLDAEFRGYDEMLEALKHIAGVLDVESYPENGSLESMLGARARAAINRAEGR